MEHRPVNAEQIKVLEARVLITTILQQPGVKVLAQGFGVPGICQCLQVIGQAVEYGLQQSCAA